MFFRPSLKYFNWDFMHCSTRPPTKCNVTYYGYNYSMWYQMVHLISYHIFERKWNWPTIVLKYFVSEKIISTKNGGGGTHFAKSLNFKFLKGLTHSAMGQKQFIPLSSVEGAAWNVEHLCFSPSTFLSSEPWWPPSLPKGLNKD